MKKVKYQNIEVDRCVGCNGIWFDMLELEHLKAIEGSESIDIGSSQAEKRFNKMSHLNCPVCMTQMIPMVDNNQPQIWYESCKSCYGIFFDAGEFKDYKEETVMDFFKALFAKKRV